MSGAIFEALGRARRPRAPAQRGGRRTGRRRVVALSYGFWQSQWGRDPAIVGRAITLGGVPYTVVGVLVPGVPASGHPGRRLRAHRGGLSAGGAIPRRSHAPRRSAARARNLPAAARADLDAAMKHLAAAHPDEDKYLRPDFVPLLDGIVGDSRRPALDPRGRRRHGPADRLREPGEPASRPGLGTPRRAGRPHGAWRDPGTSRAADPDREPRALALAGGACGILLAAWGTQLLLAAMPDAPPAARACRHRRRHRPLRRGGLASDGNRVRDPSGLEGLGRGFAPGLAGPRGQGGISTGRLRDAFVVAEIALAMVLLVAAGLLLHGSGVCTPSDRVSRRTAWSPRGSICPSRATRRSRRRRGSASRSSRELERRSGRRGRDDQRGPADRTCAAPQLRDRGPASDRRRRRARALFAQHHGRLLRRDGDPAEGGARLSPGGSARGRRWSAS